jgi:stearoyl-CoA desaturase (delta-9 desaturase)
VYFGYPAVQFNNAGLYRKVAKDESQVARYAKDLPPDRWDKVLFDHALLGLAIGIGLLIWAAGWEIGVVASVVHLAVYLLGGGAINGIGHKWGKRPYEGLATNNQWLAYLVAGEGLHSNHHAASTSARFSHERGQHDPGWWVLRPLVAMKLATVRHETVAVKTRATV